MTSRPVASASPEGRPAPESEREDVGSHRLPVLALIAVTVGSLWPAVEHFRTRALADRFDATVFTWAWWEMPRAVARGDNPFQTTRMFHPVGADIALTTTTPLIAALTWPIRAALGPNAQINAVQLGAGFLAGLGAYLLAHRICRQRGPALFAGIAFMLTSHRLLHARGHLNLIHSWVLPFGCLLLLRFVDAPSRGRALALGAFGGATVLIDPQLTLFLILALLPLAVLHRAALRSHVVHLVTAAVLAVLVALPLLAPMALAISHDEVNPPLPVRASLLWSASPLAWVLPPSDNVLFGGLVGERSPSPDIEGLVYPGLVLLGLAIASVRLVERKRRRGWTALAVLGVVLSFGPYLVFYDTSIDLPMPYFLLRALPGLDLQRVPGRFAYIGVLGMVVLAASALTELTRRYPDRARAMVGAALLFTTLDLFPTGLPQRSGTVPEPFYAIAEDPGDGAVMELPVQWYTGEQVVGLDGRRYHFSFLLHAIVHGKPIVSGGVSRYPEHRLDELRAIPLYQQVLSLQGSPSFDEEARFDEDDLAEMGIGYVVYNRARPAPAAFAYFDALSLRVLADDGTVIVWVVDGG